MTDMDRLPKANSEMVQGFMDGYDMDCPEPSENRSRSYRHGFANGRDDRRGKPRASFETIVEWANEAMAVDAAQLQTPTE